MINTSLLSIHLVARCSRGLLILSQVNQQLPELFFARSARSTLCALSTQVHQLSNPLPACTAGGSIFSICQELFSIFACLGDGLLGLLGVVLVEIVNRLSGCFYCPLFLRG